MPTVPDVEQMHPQDEALPGCCDSCDGKGATLEGPCWDCQATGHAHAGPCDPTSGEFTDPDLRPLADQPAPADGGRR